MGNGLLDEPVYPRFVQGLDQLAGEIKGGALDYAEELNDSAVVLDQIEETPRLQLPGQIRMERWGCQLECAQHDPEKR